MSEITDNVTIVKVGTHLLTQQREGQPPILDRVSIGEIAPQVAALEHGILVTSGAITAAMRDEGLVERPDNPAELRSLAAVGNLPVYNAWANALRGKRIAQVLLTRHELLLREERQTALETLHQSLAKGHIPVVNENDAVSDEEITFGDNDILSVELAMQMAFSELFGNNVRLVLLTNVDGLYADPGDPSTLISEITQENIGECVVSAKGVASKNSKGGMESKVEAASRALKYGIDMRIANGRTPNAVQLALAGKIGTRVVHTA